jgi:hypothetical protein
LRDADERVWLRDAVLARPFDLPPIRLPLRLFAAIECAVVADLHTMHQRVQQDALVAQIVERERVGEK